MSAQAEYRRALRNSGLWLFAWPAAVWMLSLLSRGELPLIVIAVGLATGALTAASYAFDAGRLHSERWRQ